MRTVKLNLATVLKFLFFNIYSLCISSCFLIPQNSEIVNTPYKEYLGSATPANYQKIVEEVLLDHNYHIESFDNSQTGTFITTRWNVRAPYPLELELGYQDAKTKIKVIGAIDTESFSSINNYRYDCYIEVKNLVYNGRTYIEFYGSPTLKQKMDSISKIISNKFELAGQLRDSF